MTPPQCRRRARLRRWLLRHLGVTCGAYGGHVPDIAHHPVAARWCLKPYGHPDSHAYTACTQPAHRDRLAAQGWS